MYNSHIPWTTAGIPGRVIVYFIVQTSGKQCKGGICNTYFLNYFRFQLIENLFCCGNVRKINSNGPNFEVYFGLNADFEHYSNIVIFQQCLEETLVSPSKAFKDVY